MKKFLLSLVVMFAAVASFAEKGTLCLTFDDRHFASWEKAIPLFKKYNARVTFFISGRIDKSALSTMKKLQSAGHSIGLHALNHTKAVPYFKSHGAEAYTAHEIMPQLYICSRNGIKIRAFAYPSSLRNAETDEEMFRTFDFLRTNCGRMAPDTASLIKADGFYYSKVNDKQLFCGYPVSGEFNAADIKKVIDRAAAENATIVFYAHDITEKFHKTHHIAVSHLEELLKYAVSKGVALKGMNDL